MTIIGPAQAVALLLEGRDIQVDGVRYRLKDRRIHAVVSGREFPSAIKLTDLLYGVLDDNPDRTPPWGRLRLIEDRMDAMDSDVALLVSLAGDQSMPGEVREKAAALADAWQGLRGTIREAGI